MEKSSNLSIVMARLQDELEGIDDYANAAATCTDPELTKVFMEIQGMEKTHAKRLLQWVNANAEKLLS